MSDLTGGIPERPELVPCGELMNRTLEAIEAVGSLTEAHLYCPTGEHAIANLGIATGFRDLDTITGGMSRGDLWVITGHSGAGKSVLALNLVRAASIAYVATSEVYLHYDSLVDFTLRLLSAECGIAVGSARTGRMNDEDWTRYARKIHDDVFHARISVWSAGLTDESAVDQAVSGGSLRRQPRLIVVDEVLPEACGDDLLELRRLARTSGATVVAVLSDGPEDELAHVESVAARIADVVLRVDRQTAPWTFRPEDDGQADLVLVRHRRGPVARIRVAFQGYYSRFADLP